MAIYGDTTATLSGKKIGKHQTLTGIDSQDNEIFGDAAFIIDNAKGGNDTLTGGDNSGSGEINNRLYGDAFDMRNNARGGNDT